MSEIVGFSYARSGTLSRSVPVVPAKAMKRASRVGLGPTLQSV